MSVISDILALKNGKTYVYYDSSFHENKQLISQCDIPGQIGQDARKLRDDVWKLYENGHCVLFQEKMPDETFLYKVMRV